MLRAAGGRWQVILSEFRSWAEPSTQLAGGFTVSLGRRLCVDGKRSPRVGVAEPGLSNLYVDSFVEQGGSGGVAIMWNST